MTRLRFGIERDADRPAGRVPGMVGRLAMGVLWAAIAAPAGAQEPGPPGRPVSGFPAVSAGRAARECLELPWPTPPPALSDRRLSARCDVTDHGELPSTGRTTWAWSRYYRESVYGPTPQTPPESLDLFPDTVRLDELVLFAADPDDDRLRAVWHDRVDRTALLVDPPRARAIPEGGALLIHRLCLNGTGGCLDHPYLLGAGGRVVPLEPSYRGQLLDSLPEEWRTWKGIWLEPDPLRASAGVYLPGDANCCPSLRARASLRLRGGELVADSWGIVPVDDEGFWRVLPGERFGPVGTRTSEADLTEAVGASQVTPARVYMAEGFCTPGTYLFPGRPYELEVAWADSARTRPAFARARDPAGPWRTPLGVGVGTTLASLEAMKGEPVHFSGFGWDYGGGAGWDEGGGTLGLRLRIAPESDPRLLELSQQDPRTEEIFGDRPVRSDHPVVRQLTIVVEEVAMSWAGPFSERSCEAESGRSQVGPRARDPHRRRQALGADSASR